MDFDFEQYIFEYLINYMKWSIKNEFSDYVDRE